MISITNLSGNCEGFWLPSNNQTFFNGDQNPFSITIRQSSLLGWQPKPNFYGHM